jgi:hypothetical protein
VAIGARGSGVTSTTRVPDCARELLVQVAAGAVAAFFVTWAGYRFSIGRLGDFAPTSYMGTPAIPPADTRSGLIRWLCRLPMPVPEVLHGALFLRAHDHYGHTAFLFGRLSEHGFWNFYLVGLLMKSPLPFLALVAAAAAVPARRRARVLDPRALGAAPAALATLALSTVMTVDIGLRHRSAPCRCSRCLREARWGRGSRPCLFQAGARAPGARSPSYSPSTSRSCNPPTRRLFAYFNPLAGREPGHALIDSDLDWGQDLGLLKRQLRARQTPPLTTAPSPS